MNSACYKTIFSARLGALVAVGEHAAGRGKTATASGVSLALLWFAMTSVARAEIAGHALPVGPTLVQGAATVKSGPGQMQIRQTTDKAVLNWQSFNVGASSLVRIDQPSAQSVLLDRVVGRDASKILGRLEANGQVVLVNPNGIVFGKDGSVSASAFTASTLGISDSDFMAGRMHFHRNGSNAGVRNEGLIRTTSAGGYVALLGARVSNEGRIETRQGDVLMAAGEKASFSVPLTGRIKLELTPAQIDSVVSNGHQGLIMTEGGNVLMRVDALASILGRVEQLGTLDTSGQQAGRVDLLADHGEIRMGGSILANSSAASQRGGRVIIGRDESTGILAADTDISGALIESKGGFVEASGNRMNIRGARVRAKELLLDPTNVTVSAAPGSSVNWNVTDVEDQLAAGTNVTIATDGSIQQSDPITVTNNSGQDVTLTYDTRSIAGGNITSTAGIAATGTNLVSFVGLTRQAPIFFSAGIDVNGSITLDTTSRDPANPTVPVPTSQWPNVSAIRADAGLIAGRDIVLHGQTTQGPFTSQAVSVAGDISAGRNVDIKGDMNFNGTNVSHAVSVLGNVSSAQAIAGGTLSIEARALVNGPALVTGSGKTIASGTSLIPGGDITILASNAAVIGATFVATTMGGNAASYVANGANVNLGTAADPISGGAGAFVRNVTATRMNGVGGDVNIFGRTSWRTDISGARAAVTSAGAIQADGRVYLQGDFVVGQDAGTARGVEITGSRISATQGIEIVGTTTASHGYGVALTPTTSTQLISSGGAILISGTSSAATAGTGAGMALLKPTTFDAAAGTSLTGTAAMTGSSGVLMGDIASPSISITATNGQLNVTGNGGAAGISMVNAVLTANSGSPQVLSLEGSASGAAFGVNIGSGGKLAASGTGKFLNISSNSLNIDTSSGAIDATGAPLIIRTASNAAIDLGGADVGQSTLGLSAAEIGRIKAASLSIGDTNASSINVSDDVTFGADIGSARLFAQGSMGSTSGSITAGGLALFSSEGSINLDSVNNKVNILTAGAPNGSIKIVNSQGLTVGTVDGNSGLTAQGPISVATRQGDLSLTSAITTSDATADAVVLNAGEFASAGTPGGGNLLIGIADPIAMGPAGRATLYSGSITGSTGLSGLVGAGSGRFRYNSDEQISHFTSALGSGLHAIYREAPVLTRTLNAAQKIYDGQTFSGGNGATTSGTLHNGDTDALVVGTLSYSGASQTARNVGTYVLDGSGETSALGYTLNYVGSALTINKRDVTLNALSSNNKVYDGNQGAVITSGVFGNLVPGETLNVSGTGQFNNKNAGAGKTVTVADVSTLTKTNGSGDWTNYNLTTSGALTTTAAITKKDVTLTALTASDKVYDGNQTATITSGVIGNAVAGETLTVNGTGQFNNKNVGSGKTVTVADVSALTKTNGSGDWNNYNLTTGGSLTTTAAVTKRNLAITATASDKAYDGNTSATTVLASNMVSGDSLSLSKTGATFDTKNAGSGKTVSVTGLSIGGTDAANYTLTNTGTTTTAAITQRDVTLTGLTVTDKVYDGSQTASISSGVIGNLVAGESLGLSGTGQFNDKNVGTGKTVTVADVSTLTKTNGSGDWNNYNLTTGGALTTTAAITKRDVTLTALTASDKIYDGNQAAIITSGVIGNAVAGETLAVNGTGQFNNKDVGTGKTVTVGDVNALTKTNGSGDWNNYNLTTTGAFTTTAAITKRDLAITATASDKVYDGNTSATTVLASNMVPGDSLSLSKTGATFDTKNAGSGKTVSVTGLSIGGTDAANYTLTNTAATTTAAITKRDVTLTGVTASDKVYDGNETALLTGGSVVGTVPGETLLISGTGQFDDKNAGAGKTVTVSDSRSLSLANGTGDWANYRLVDWTAPLTTQAAVTPKPLTVVGTSVPDKVFDGDTRSQVSIGSLDGLVGLETLRIASANGQFLDPAVGNGKPVRVSYELANGTNGGLAANYTVSSSNHQASITALIATQEPPAVVPPNVKEPPWTAGALPVSISLPEVRSEEPAAATNAPQNEVRKRGCALAEVNGVYLCHPASATKSRTRW